MKRKQPAGREGKDGFHWCCVSAGRSGRNGPYANTAITDGDIGTPEGLPPGGLEDVEGIGPNGTRKDEL